MFVARQAAHRLFGGNCPVLSNVLCKLQEGKTPLHAAVKHGHADVVESLLSRHPNVNFADHVSGIHTPTVHVQTL